MTAYLRNERSGEEAISKIGLAAYRNLTASHGASEYGRVISRQQRQAVKWKSRRPNSPEPKPKAQSQQ